MRYLVATLCTLGFLVTGSLKLSAAEFTDLFQAQVPAQQSQSQWQRAALSAVLVKLTGSETVLSHPAIAVELKNSASYVKQFQSMQVNAQPMMQVHLDEQKITALLQREHIAIWGSRRPDQLVWFSEKMQDSPHYVLDAEHPLRKALHEQASIFALSLVFPLYDVDDLALVNEQTLWAGEWTAIQSASLRYKASHVHNLLFDQFTDASGTVVFRLTAQQWRNGQMESREYTNMDARQLAIEFSRQLAADLASQYAVNINNNQAEGAVLTLTIDAIRNMADLVKVQQIFGSMLTVKSYSLKEFQQGKAVLNVHLAASEDDFFRNISLVTQLRAESQLQPIVDAGILTAEAQLDAQLEADSIEPSTADTAQTATNPSSVNDSVGATPGTTGNTTATDSTTAVTADLPPTSEPALNAGAAESQTSALPAADALIKTNHFTFVGN